MMVCCCVCPVLWQFKNGSREHINPDVITTQSLPESSALSAEENMALCQNPVLWTSCWCLPEGLCSILPCHRHFGSSELLGLSSNVACTTAGPAAELFVSGEHRFLSEWVTEIYPNMVYVASNIRKGPPRLCLFLSIKMCKVQKFLFHFKARILDIILTFRLDNSWLWGAGLCIAQYLAASLASIH